MIIFRPHAMGESLEESMAEAREFQDVNEMKEYICQQRKQNWNGKEFFTVDDIVIDDRLVYSDDRIGWEDVKSVCIKRFGEVNYIEEYGYPQCIGHCATKYKSLNNEKIKKP